MKYLVCLFLILQILPFAYSQAGANKCSDIEKDVCRFCVQKSGCAWCEDKSYTGARCDTPENLKTKCPGNLTVNPVAKEEFPENKPVGPSIQMSPQKVKLNLRVGEKFTFRVNVRPAENYPVDLYYLMDLSYSMADDLNNLKILAVNISNKLTELTNKHRLAFGSFVDKDTQPYVKYENVGKPFCYGRPESCGDIPYDFKHILDFTYDAKEFEKKIGETTFSGNRDVHEGMFDALMQLAVCEKELGWNEKSKTRRMVVIATDGPFHLAGEGKFGGIVEPNDEQCHLVRKDGFRFYSKALELDYPSVNQMYRRLKASQIQPIFAIGSEVARQSYVDLTESWTDLSATLDTLGERSENIVELIEKSYKAIVSTVQILTSPPEGVQVTITPNCGDALLTTDGCKGVGLQKDISFDIGVTVDSCNKGNSTKFDLLATGFGKVEVEIDIICKCDCQSIQEPDSNECSGNGTFVCGGCDCNAGWTGDKCQCDLSTGRPSKASATCKQSNSSNLICEGNGDCVCGECQCKLVGKTNKKYYGKYCQCSDFNCEQYENKLCGGERRGDCKCGQCVCKKGYIGTNCGTVDCRLEVGKCLVGGVNCSGKGQCRCGVCKCDPFYEGKLCESCPSCAGKCADYKLCVLCQVFKEGFTNKTQCDACPKVVKLKTVDEMTALGYPEVCEYRDSDGCKYTYTYGNEDGGNVTIYAVTKKECPEGPNVLMIVLAVIGGIVGIGILLLILWKVLTAMVDRKEYEKFERDRAKSKWHREKNPLYQPATSTVQNPTFVGSRT